MPGETWWLILDIPAKAARCSKASDQRFEGFGHGGGEH